MGYTRFLFAKPISVRWYYFQSLLVRTVGYFAIGIVLILAYNYFEPPTLSPKMLADMLVSFVSIGGIVFLVSVVSRYDGLVAIVFLLVSSVIWGRVAREGRDPLCGHVSRAAAREVGRHAQLGGRPERNRQPGADGVPVEMGAVERGVRIGMFRLGPLLAA